jgi:4,4'-diaponeurosporenoate glycosyltransferase
MAFELARWALGFLVLWRMPRPTGVRSDGAVVVDATVVIPARNEARNLALLLPTVVPQAAEVIVVDDSSSDATAHVAEMCGARVVRAADPPRGWLGKPWACHTGAGAATRDVLVFLDADVVVERAGLARIVDAQRDDGGLVSVQPWHEVHRLHEMLSAFPNLLGVMGVGAFTVLGRRLRPRGAFGPCIAIDRRTYDAIGGHESVRDRVIEDVALAQRAPAVTLYGGKGVVRYRMYGDGLRSLWRGWTKNIAAGAGSTHPLVLLVVVAWMSGAIQAPFTATWLSLMFVAQLWWFFRRIGGFGLVTAFFYPIPLAFFLVLFAASALKTVLRRPVEWRGRSVPTR